MTVTDVFKLFFLKQISEDDKENGRRCNENIHPRPFYIDRYLCQLLFQILTKPKLLRKLVLPYLILFLSQLENLVKIIKIHFTNRLNI